MCIMECFNSLNLADSVECLVLAPGCAGHSDKRHFEITGSLEFARQCDDKSSKEMFYVI